MRKNKEKKQKIKKERKPISNMDKFMLVFLATLIIYLAIILPIRLCAVTFSWHWFVFGLIAVIIPFAFIHFQLWAQKKNTFTDEQKKTASIVTVKYIIYFWFLDCLYMAIFNQWKVCIYILGIITLVKIFYSLAITFLGKKQKNIILDISLVFDFLLGVGLTVYLIYLIPNNFSNLQTIITAVVAAVYGGLLTLVGVAWTIKHSEKQKRDDERAKAKPLFTFNIINVQEPDIVNRKLCFIYDTDPVTGELKTSDGVVSYIEFENSANSSFIIKRLYFDNSWHRAYANNTLLPNNKLLVQLHRKNLIERPIMEIEDIYERKFYYDLMFICLPTYQNILFCSLGELKEITLQEIQERNISLDD